MLVFVLMQATGVVEKRDHIGIKGTFYQFILCTTFYQTNLSLSTKRIRILVYRVTSRVWFGR